MPASRIHDVCVITTIHQPYDARIYERGIRVYAENGVDVAVVCPWEYAADSGVAPDAWHRTRPAKVRRQRLRLDWETFQAARQVQARVYHFHDFDFLPWAVRLQQETGRPVVYDCHEHYPDDVLHHKPWIPAPFRSPLSVAVRLIENWAVKRLKYAIVVVPSLVDRFRAMGVEAVLVRNIARVDAQPDLPHERALLYAGSVSKIYGVDTLVEIARALKRRGSDIPLIVPDRFTSKEMRDEFVAAATNEQLALRIVPQVPARELYKLLRLGAIGLVTDQPTPTMANGMHAKFFDYMAAGLPMLAGDLANARALIESTGCGVLVPTGDADAYAAAAIALLDDPARLEQMRQNGFRAFTEQYSFRIEQDKLLGFIRRLGAEGLSR